MTSRSQSLMDFVALDRVRERFARGDAMLILDAGLDRIAWANGGGAQLFGFSDTWAAKDAMAPFSTAARRQLKAARGFPDIARDSPVSLSAARGTLGFLASAVVLPGGERGILLAQPASESDPAAAVSGLTAPGFSAALTDSEGRPLAASPGFAALGFSTSVLTALAAQVNAGAPINRLVPGASTSRPVRALRLDQNTVLLTVSDDDPGDFPALERIETAYQTGFALNSVSDYARQHATGQALGTLAASDAAEPGIVPEVEDGAAHEAEADASAIEPASEEDTDFITGGNDASEDSPSEQPTKTVGLVELDTPEAAAEQDRNQSTEVSADGSGEKQDEPSSGDEPSSATVPPDGDPAVEGGDAPDDALAGDDGGLIEHGESGSPTVAVGSAQHERSFEETRTEEAQIEESTAAPPVAWDDGPVRFTWRSDANGRFTALSREFTDAMGLREEELLGQLFSDVADRFGFDPDQEIATLLTRQDTWSGRTVHWPLDGHGVPVDLAALPVYSADRTFEGFRGFGIARLQDAEELQPGPVEAAATEVKEDRPPEAAVGPMAERGVPSFVAAPAAPQLSPHERTAFQEIGERLRLEGAAPVVPSILGAESAARPINGGSRVDQVPASEGDALPAAKSPPVEAHDKAIPALVIPAKDNADFAAAALDEGGNESKQVEPEAGQGDSRLTDQSRGVESQRAPADEPSPRPRPDTSILERLPVPVLIHSGDVLHYANPEFLALTGYESLDPLRARGGLDALLSAPDDSGMEGDPDDRRMRLTAASGATMPVDALLRSVPWAGGSVLLLVVRRLDASPAEGERSGDEIERRVAEMRAIVDTATDGVVLIAPDGTIRSLSQPAEALFGIDSDKAGGRPFGSLFSIESQHSVADYLDGLSNNGVASVLHDGREVMGRESSGGLIPLFMTVGKLPEGSGFCAVLRDITQWKRAEEQLTQSRTLAELASSHKTDFLARVSHEIRTPLNAIIGFSELMLDEKFGPVSNDRYRDYLRDINRSGNHVLDLVNDLLDISKIEAGEQDMTYEAVSLNDALAEAVATMQPQANRERVIIRSSFADDLPDVVADLRSVRQIAFNILSNAVRYTQAGGQVIVSTALEASGDVALRVRDTGIGMTQGEMEQAMKPFRQINALKRPRGDGTGLGLPLTKAMAEANRAQFSISSAPGEGTLVEIVFPVTRVLAG